MDLAKVSVPIFQEVFRKILDDLGMIAAKCKYGTSELGLRWRDDLTKKLRIRDFVIHS